MATWWRLVGLLLVAVLGAVLGATDYCQLPSCPNNSHTACKFKPGEGPSEQCTKDAGVLAASERQEILDKHNELRRDLAAGKLDGFAGALDMETMQWDEELELIAQTWANQCKYGHDECRNSERWPVGQNIAMTGQSSGYQAEILKKVMLWWDEYKDYSYHDGTFNFNHKTGHFTQMAWAKTNKIGCGRTSYKQGDFINEYLVCNYAPAGNVQGQKMYTAKASATAASSIIVSVGLIVWRLCIQ